mmetsp:Transcript_34977/g.63879  ORF Transcript_34977/g.63879 Transcript_34977/m.63879 type:complete len:99 (+) Transcript_34977:136-432(+)
MHRLLAFPTIYLDYMVLRMFNWSSRSWTFDVLDVKPGTNVGRHLPNPKGLQKLSLRNSNTVRVNTAAAVVVAAAIQVMAMISTEAGIAEPGSWHWLVC